MRDNAVLTPEISRSQLEHFAATCHLESHLAEQPEALVPRIPWYDLPRKERIKWRKIALTLLLEPFE